MSIELEYFKETGIIEKVGHALRVVHDKMGADTEPLFTFYKALFPDFAGEYDRLLAEVEGARALNQELKQKVS